MHRLLCGQDPELSGLRVDPCIPEEMDGFTADRKYRGTLYHITVENPSHVQKGVRQILADGVPVEGNILPLFKDRKEVSITVTMG